MSGKRLNRWAEFIRTGGAATLFDTYPSDAELADVINNFPDAIPVTAAQIHRDRQRFHNRPRRGEVIREEEGSPTKNVIRNKASQLEVREALVEILDNIFDNFERNTPDRLKVDISVFPKTEAAPGEMLISENSGGVEKTRVIPLIQLGFSERSARGIGAWGEGFKMAVFALGEEVEVFSAYPGQQPLAIHFPRGWLDPSHAFWKKWKVNTYEVVENPPSEGATVIRINHLHSKVLASFGLSGRQSGKESEAICEDLARYFGQVYAEKYHTLESQGHSNISIRINIGSVAKEVRFADRAKARLVKHLAFLPWLRPIRWTAAWETEIEEPSEEGRYRTARLSVEVYAGLTATFDGFQSYSLQAPGLEMWGNGRLFTLKGKITDKSVGWHYRFGGAGGSNPASTASSRRLTIIALFTADDSRDIPWAAPVKNDYNRRSEFYAEIQGIFAKVIRLYKNALRLLESRLLPFSYAWTQYTDVKKLDTLFTDSDASPEFKQEFANSRFGKKLLAFRPDLTFHEMHGKDAESTVYRVFGISTTAINNIVQAASETKTSANQTVEFLEALFPSLARQAKLEEEFGLAPDEELEL
jgi:hypothetical protein